MEFFREIETGDIDIGKLQGMLTIARLTELCASIDKVLQDNGNDGEIYCIWGQFIVHRENLKQGVRFTLPFCPNAFAWTVGYNKNINKLVIHSTIDRKEHDQDFIDTINQFMDDWQEGLEKSAIASRTV